MRPGNHKKMALDIFAGYPCREPNPFLFCVLTIIVIGAGLHVLSNPRRKPRAGFAYGAAFAWSLFYGGIVALDLVYACWFAAIYSWGLSGVRVDAIPGQTVLWRLFGVAVWGVLCLTAILLLFFWFLAVTKTITRLTSLWGKEGQDPQGEGEARRKGEKETSIRNPT